MYSTNILTTLAKLLNDSKDFKLAKIEFSGLCYKPAVAWLEVCETHDPMSLNSTVGMA